MLNRFRNRDNRRQQHASFDTNVDSTAGDLEKEAGRPLDDGPVRWMTLRVFIMAVIVSIGGFIFGYDTGIALNSNCVIASI
jgi:MFS transporter, SP family, sugar:H+ symporter